MGEPPRLSKVTVQPDTCRLQTAAMVLSDCITALICAVPGAKAVTVPPCVTAATAELSVLQITSVSILASAGS